MAANVQAAQNLLQNTNIKTEQGLQISRYIDGIPKSDWNTVRKVELDQMLAQKRFGNFDQLNGMRNGH